MWQFFILNKESWMGNPVPVIPLTIGQYMKILEHTYQNNLEIDQFNNLLQYIHKGTTNFKNYEIWDKNIEKYIEEWKKKEVS